MFRQRLRILTRLFALSALLVLGRVFQLQVLEGEHYREEAQFLASRTFDLPAVRGAIYDRDGAPLARDRCAFTVMLVPSRYRDQSLFYAVGDLTLLLHPRAQPVRDVGEGRALGDGPGAILALLRSDPASLMRDVLSLPASALLLVEDERSLAARGSALEKCTARSWSNAALSGRLRELLSIVQGAGLPVTPKLLKDLAERSGTLAEALGITVSDAIHRLRSELQGLETLARHVELASLDAAFDALAELEQREQNWVEARIHEELVAAVCVEHLGTPWPSPAMMDPAQYLETARRLEIPFPDDNAARDAVESATALLSGGLPEAGSDRPDVEPDGALLEVARREGLWSLEPARFAEEFAKRVLAAPDSDISNYLPQRRQRSLASRYRGGRAFVFGHGAPVEVSRLVEGPGGLGRLGFRLRPAFERDASVRSDAGVALLLRDVNRAQRRGTAGVEARVEEFVRGVPGEGYIREDGVSGRSRPPAHGRAIGLTLSLALQERVQAALSEHLKEAPGAVAVVDVRTGGILALATNPLPDVREVDAALESRSSLDRESLLLRRLEANGSDWARARLDKALARRRSDPWLDREVDLLRAYLERGDAWLRESRFAMVQALGGSHAGFHRAFENPEQCPPGSVFKALTILCGLERRAIDIHTQVTCTLPSPDRTRFRCKGHGPVGVLRALKKSCNAFCYEVGAKLGTDVFVDLYRDLGLFDEIPGLLPATPQNLSGDDPRNLAIGQGSLTAPPVRVAGLTAALARGQVVRPHLFLAPDFCALGAPLVGDRENLTIVHEGMREVVRPGGTAANATLDRLDVAGKTGTADYFPMPDAPSWNQAWFAGFAPALTARSPEFAVAIVLNHTTLHGGDAAPLAAKVFEACGEVFPQRRWW